MAQVLLKMEVGDLGLSLMREWFVVSGLLRRIVAPLMSIAKRAKNRAIIPAIWRGILEIFSWEIRRRAHSQGNRRLLEMGEGQQTGIRFAPGSFGE
jgi:hypothetical protein